MRPLQPRERRLAAIGVLVAVIAGIWLGLVSPLIGGFVGRRSRGCSGLMTGASP